jgi:hypothetical protein
LKNCMENFFGKLLSVIGIVSRTFGSPPQQLSPPNMYLPTIRVTRCVGAKKVAKNVAQLMSCKN